MLDLPILFIVFNRPDETKRVLEKIAEVKPNRIYIAADGHRPESKTDLEKCHLVRKLILDRIDWKCEVKTLFREKNLGCRLAVSSAIDWFFSFEEEGIILEDDTLPDVSFFLFCKELLTKYRNDSRIGMISGDNFGFGYKRNMDSYFFTRYTHVWGWATWRRVWEGYSVDIPDYPKFRNENWLKDIFPDDREIEFWKTNFDKVGLQKFNTWDFQFVYNNLKNSRLNIIPNVNLVSNIGFNLNATHTTGNSKYANMRVESIKFPLIHPDFFIVDIRSSEMLRSSFLPPPENFLKRILKKLITVFKSKIGFNTR